MRQPILLLALSMPRLSGNDVLAQIKPDPDLSSIRVVVLTCSNATSDIKRSGR